MTNIRPSLADLNSYLAARTLLESKQETPIVGQLCIALAMSRGNIERAKELVSERYDNARILQRSLDRHLNRDVVDPGSTPGGESGAWGNQLTDSPKTIESQFLDLVRPRTILGRLPGVRHVPLNTIVPTQTLGMGFSWVSEGVGAPAGKLTVSNSSVLWSKVSGIVAFTRDLIKFSNVAAQMIQNDMVKGSATFLDGAFIDPDVNAVDYTRPGGILNGIAATGNASGTTAAAFRADMKALISAINVDDPSELVVLMSTTDALNLSLMGNEFPELKATGGFIGGLPVIASEGVGQRLIVLHAPSLLLADGNELEIDYSDQATVEMDTLPVQGNESPVTSITVLRSFFQANLAGFKITRWVNWKMGVSGRVKWLTNTNYGG